MAWLPPPSDIPDDDSMGAAHAIKTHFQNSQYASMAREFSYMTLQTKNITDQKPSPVLLKGVRSFFAGLTNKPLKYVLVKGSLGNPPLPVYQMVTLERKVISRTTGFQDNRQTETVSYPLSPISNLVVAVIQSKRSHGEFVATRQSGHFLPNPAIPSSVNLLHQLNNLDLAPGAQAEAHTISQAATLLFSYDRDYFQDKRIKGWSTRAYRDRTNMKWGWSPGIQRYHDDTLLPTLLETEVLNVETWSNYPKREKPSPFHPGESAEHLKDKHFFVGIVPYRDSTIVVMNYPTMAIFNTQGELQEVNLLIPWVGWIIGGILKIISDPSNTALPSENQAKETHPYHAAVGAIRTEKVWASKEKWTNLSVPPFEYALACVDNEGAGQTVESSGFGEELLALVSECGAIDQALRDSFLKENSPDMIASEFAWLEPSFSNVLTGKRFSGAQGQLARYYYAATLVAHLTEKEFNEFLNYVPDRGGAPPGAFLKACNLSTTPEADQRRTELMRAVQAAESRSEDETWEGGEEERNKQETQAKATSSAGSMPKDEMSRIRQEAANVFLAQQGVQEFLKAHFGTNLGLTFLPDGSVNQDEHFEGLCAEIALEKKTKPLKEEAVELKTLGEVWNEVLYEKHPEMKPQYRPSRYCTNCGQPSTRGAFCTKCGARLTG